MAQIAVVEVARYACEDADITFRLRNELQPKLDNGGLTDLFREVEIPLIFVLQDVEHAGVSLDDV